MPFERRSTRSLALRAAADPRRAAQVAELTYVSDATAGIRRVRSGRGFRYLLPDRRPVRDADEQERIRRLAVPPAWRDVWICPDPHGHIQAIGRDARGRRQYRYHPRWRQLRDEAKFSRMVAFGRALPAIRARVDAALSRSGLSREKVIALVVRLLEITLIRVGNEEYARGNASFGLTTLRRRHVEVTGGELRFRFRGKSGKEHAFGIRDRRLSQLVRRCQELPGQELFRYVDDEGRTRGVGSADVNAYLRAISGLDLTAKDFRTWAGTVRAAYALKVLEPFSSTRQAKGNVARAVESVATRLGNTPVICRRSYVHPVVVETYLDGTLSRSLRGRRRRRSPSSGLTPHEQAVLDMLTWVHPHGRGARARRERGSAGPQRPGVPSLRTAGPRRRGPDEPRRAAGSGGEAGAGGGGVGRRRGRVELRAAG
jgi:DNA topoisomerase-1